MNSIKINGCHGNRMLNCVNFYDLQLRYSKIVKIFIQNLLIGFQSRILWVWFLTGANLSNAKMCLSVCHYKVHKSSIIPFPSVGQFKETSALWAPFLSFSVVAFHPDISRVLLYSAGEDYKIRVWNLQNSTCIKELDAHYSLVTCIDFSADGSKAFT